MQAEDDDLDAHRRPRGGRPRSTRRLGSRRRLDHEDAAGRSSSCSRSMAGIAAWLVADHRAWGRVVAAWNQLSGPSAHAGEARPSKDWIKSLGPRFGECLGRDAPPLERAGRGDRPEDGPRQGPDRADHPPAHRRDRLRPGDARRSSAPSSTAASTRSWSQLGSVVKKGDPLLEVFSTDLAEAKSNYEMARQPVEPRQEGARLQGPSGQERDHRLARS